MRALGRREPGMQRGVAIAVLLGTGRREKRASERLLYWDNASW